MSLFPSVLSAFYIFFMFDEVSPNAFVRIGITTEDGIESIEVLNDKGYELVRTGVPERPLIELDRQFGKTMSRICFCTR